MQLRRAKSVEEYIDWVKNARFEAQDLRECLMFETEEMPRFPVYLEPQEQSANTFYQEMSYGFYHFGPEGLPYSGAGSPIREANPIPSAVEADQRGPSQGAGD